VGAPLIPYIKVPEIPLPLPKPVDSIKPFGLLVATGVYLGSVVAIRRARQRGLDLEKMNTFIFYVVGIGFVGAHVFDAIFYTPERLSEDPLYLLKLWAGLSSYGGFFGAIFGLFLYKWKYKENVIGFADTVCSAFPLAWVFGRMGCATVHDHPGRLTTSWLGVQFGHPDVRNPEVIGLLSDPNQILGRFDLGFIEMVLSIPLAVAFHFLWKQRPRPYGFFSGWMCIAYAPVRFVLDFFRIEPGDPIPEGIPASAMDSFRRLIGAETDPRHFGLTPAQYACFLLLGIGVLLVRFSKFNPAPASWADVTPWEPPPEEGDLDAPKKAKGAEKLEKSDKDAPSAPVKKKKRRREPVKTSPSTPAAKRSSDADTKSDTPEQPDAKAEDAKPEAADVDAAKDKESEQAEKTGEP
jgi:phosphatidylglycerol:prolipoprotein diacylglycerol transferase